MRPARAVALSTAWPTARGKFPAVVGRKWARLAEWSATCVPFRAGATPGTETVSAREAGERQRRGRGRFMFFMPFQVLGVWLRGLFALGVLALGGYLLYQWYDHRE